MICLELFLTFMKIGAVSFGGGYGMISLIREECLSAGWLTETELLDFIAVAESTPGPVAVNMATFVGSSQGGIWGALAATAGVVLPSFAVIFAIAAVLKNILRFGGVRAALEGVRPAVAGLIVATAAVMGAETFFSVKGAGSAFSPDWKSLIVLAVLTAFYFVWKILFKKPPSPIALIVLSGVLGIFIF